VNLVAPSVLYRDHRGPLYIVTPQGHEAAENAETCQCNQLWVRDGVFECGLCGSIYGIVFGFSVPPRKLRGVDRRH